MLIMQQNATIAANRHYVHMEPASVSNKRKFAYGSEAESIIKRLKLHGVDIAPHPTSAEGVPEDEKEEEMETDLPVVLPDLIESPDSSPTHKRKLNSFKTEISDGAISDDSVDGDDNGATHVEPGVSSLPSIKLLVPHGNKIPDIVLHTPKLPAPMIGGDNKYRYFNDDTMNTSMALIPYPTTPFLLGGLHAADQSVGPSNNDANEDEEDENTMMVIE